MKHFILCRYNLGLFSNNVYKVSDPFTWMVHRLPKYNRLLESLKNQTNQNFQFIVSVDKDTPLEWIDLVEKTTKKHLSKSSYKLIFDIPQLWINKQEINSDWVITSRIDNDDEYLEGFVAAIQGEFRKKEEVLDIKGIQIDELTGKCYTSGRNKPNSPFLSLCEPNKGKLRTCLVKTHSTMNQAYPARFVSDKELYIQYIHERNQMNKIIGQEL